MLVILEVLAMCTWLSVESAQQLNPLEPMGEKSGVLKRGGDWGTQGGGFVG